MPQGIEHQISEDPLQTIGITEDGVGRWRGEIQRYTVSEGPRAGDDALQDFCQRGWAQFQPPARVSLH